MEGIMRDYVLMLVLLAMLTGCNSEPSSPAKAAPQSVMKSGETNVMTSEDMKKLQEDRADLIKRSSPSGEEKDAVEELRKKATGK